MSDPVTLNLSHLQGVTTQLPAIFYISYKGLIPISRESVKTFQHTPNWKKTARNYFQNYALGLSWNEGILNLKITSLVDILQ